VYQIVSFKVSKSNLFILLYDLGIGLSVNSNNEQERDLRRHSHLGLFRRGLSIVTIKINK
jgi:hypothetical protein